MVGSLNDWQKERQFQTLNEKKEERGVKVIRDGVEMVVDIKEVVVGDIALVEPGEIDPDEVHLPGIFVQRVVALSADEVGRKHIEKRTTQETMQGSKEGQG